jgi:hypothetical protein
MICHNGSTKFGNIAFKVHQVFALLEGDDIVEVNIFVAPFEVVDYSFVGQFLFNYKNVLEKLNYSLVDVEVIELSNHGFLVLQIFIVLVDQCVPFINHRSDIVKTIDVQLSLF